MKRNAKLLLTLLLALGLIGTACGPAGEDEEPALTDLDVLLEGAPQKGDDGYPSDIKADGIPPATFTGLTELQSPVKSQGSRGVCSIFSTVALMEHLYIKSGVDPDPDFSEQYLQWSVKNEVGSFRNTSGSNASSNLQAIVRYGIVAEADWPYETFQWGASNDPECAGDEGLPTKCYTNGDPPDSARNATKHKLPASRWLSSRPSSIKAYIHNNQQAVIVGGTFFYQSWNHGRSALPTNAEYKSKGYVLSPNAKDQEESLKKRAGHSFLLVGWDDNLEVQKVDGEGNKVVDAQGNPVMEKGFFLFKNSWGTGSWGGGGSQPRGYGWISYDYVDDHLSAMAAEAPEAVIPDEICGDGLDNDRDGQTDCDDADCASEPQCQTDPLFYENGTDVSIPDNDPAGAASTIQVTTGGTVQAVTVEVDIVHTYRGDLEIRLAHPDGSDVQLLGPTSDSGDDIHRTFTTGAFNSKAAAGTWTVTVIDHAAQDTGKIDRWTLKLNSDEAPPAEVCDDGQDNDLDGKADCDDSDCAAEPQCQQAGPRTYENNSPAGIPDNDPNGVTSTIQVPDSGTIRDLSLTVDISHTYRGDLEVRLVGPGGTDVQIHEPDMSSTNDLRQTWDVTGFDGQAAAGTWTLQVIDHAAADTGTLNSWSLTITR
jgi:subtilisin-like proprotein convertase family protein